MTEGSQLAIKITNPAEPESGQDERRIRAAALALWPEYHLSRNGQKISARQLAAQISLKEGEWLRKRLKRRL